MRSSASAIAFHRSLVSLPCRKQWIGASVTTRQALRCKQCGGEFTRQADRAWTRSK
jgi:hypothetical protein